MIREVSVIETQPFSVIPYRRYLMATEQEREQLKQQYPEMNVRLADKRELRYLQAEVEEE